MKTFAGSSLRFILWLAVCSSFALPVWAITFTTDTTIGVFDANYDGADIVITNCTVTIDGPHSFASLLVRNGGVLTHTQVSDGYLRFSDSITGEAHALIGTNGATLAQSNVVWASMVVRDVSGTITYSSGVDYAVTSSNPFATIARTSDSGIPDGATVLVDYRTLTTILPGINLFIGGDTLVEPGGVINVNARGYGPGVGPGAGSSAGNPASGSGAGNGGVGGAGSSNSLNNAGVGLPSGEILRPTSRGSGGGAGVGGLGSGGGGAVKLIVGGVLRIDGSISANGVNATNSRAGGGSGGSVWLSAQTVSGAGSISADGGNGEPIHGGGGAGGNIALYFSTNAFTGEVSAHGGAGFMAGGAGTIYTRDISRSAGHVLVDNGGRLGNETPVYTGNEQFDLTVRHAIVVLWEDATVGNLWLATNGFVTRVLGPPPLRLRFTVLSNATIESGGGILVDGWGSGGQGAGVTTNAGGAIGYVGSGGGHGGFGGAGAVGPPGGPTYGSLTSPMNFGVGGGAGGRGGYPYHDYGGAGGGAIRLTVNGALTVNGRISANGLSSAVLNGGGGSGGSVWIIADTLNGSGVISANGGMGNGLGGGGGGGRIALGYGTSTFSGVVSAYGGGGASFGGAGTIYRSRSQVPEAILVDNGGNPGTNTTLGTVQFSTVDLTVTGGASLVWPGNSSLMLRNLLVGSNSVLIATNAQAITLTVQSNATVQAGAWLKGDGESSVFAQQGNGLSASSPVYGTTGGGGGHGGNGSPSLAGAAGGNGGFGNVTQPITRGGSGAPTVTSGPPQGGTGGGAIRLNITGTFQLDGKLSTDGHDGYSLHSGGGAGGSLHITAGRLAGSGLISANGGRGNGVGGSGGGGRIAIYYGSNLFSGVITARGGNGVNSGGAGTVYSQRNNQSSVGAQLVLDNGGQLGVPSPLPAGSFDLILRNGTLGAWGYTSGASVRGLFISSNAWLIITDFNYPVSISSNVTIQAGGGIRADGTGSVSGQGQGAGRTTGAASGFSGSGGGHGGEGGTSGGGAIGGFAYDNVTGPNFPGSGGGAGSGSGTNAYGGRGGGIVRLAVNGTLQLDGSISAEGTVGVGFNSGGGSGGSVGLTVGTLSGSGRISANGGAGNGAGGGGGGGGRISISFATNTFAGVVSAFGGDGFVPGGAGTIYYRPTKLNVAQLLLDNGGVQGALSSYSPVPGQYFDLTLRGGAMVAITQAPIWNLFIGSNSWLIATNAAVADVGGDVTIEAGGGINSDGAASGAGQGAGPGRTAFSAIYGSTGGGGGHGGFGAASRGGALGGDAYDSITSPLLNGSDGGGSPLAIGGGGGRALRLNLPRGKLHLDGRISADGRAGNQHGGGGSGGSVWLDVGTLTGAGTISANGGAGSGVGGGGGGGRIAISCPSNGFTGAITARGGPGGSSASGWGAGGAGTIYTRTGSQVLGQVLVDNGGLFGTNTPLADIGVFNLTVSGGAVAYPSGSFLTLSNLIVNRDGLITGGVGQTNLHLAVLSNVVIAAGGAIAVDGLGFIQGNGPGAGFSADGYGGGGGHGGEGGSSMTAPGGSSYGSATEPVNRGSGGGFGSWTRYGGSQGGGAIRLNVGGTLTVDGWLSANGIAGFEDGAGGGSGGSLWINARTLRGDGFITADGGDGELFGGGGGGGGRIAVYYLTNPGHTNNFTGAMTAYGGEGFDWGDDGSVFFASSVSTLQGVAHTPNGTVSNAVSSVDVMFNTALNPFTVSSADATVTTPDGPWSTGLFAVSQLGPSSLRISFVAPQIRPGNYGFTLGPQIEDLYGRPMAQAYAGGFTIAQPTVRGTIADTNGLPVPGVIVRLALSGFMTTTTTDDAGHYALSFPPGAAFTVMPSLGDFEFAPEIRSYTNATVSIVEQNFVLLDSVAPTVSGVQQATNFFASWHGLPDVAYRVYSSTNLLDWQPCSEPMIGSNAPVSIALPLDGAPQKFFRVRMEN